MKVERKLQLGPAAARMHKALAAEVKRSAEEIRDTAKVLCPVLTGNLRGTIEAHEEGEMEWEVSEGGPTSDSPEGADYAQFVEEGTRRQTAQPHFTPAAEEVRARFEGRCTEAARKALGGV